MGSVAVLKYRLRNPVIDPVSFGENVGHGRSPASPRLLFRASTETPRAYVGFLTYPVCPGAYEDVSPGVFASPHRLEGLLPVELLLSLALSKGGHCGLVGHGALSRLATDVMLGNQLRRLRWQIQSGKCRSI